MKNLSILIIYLSGSFSFLYAQNFDKAKMDSLFDLIEANNQGMGSVSIFKDGKEVYQRSIGYLDLKNDRKADADTRYRIGSISKSYTATIVMQLIDEGKLALDTKLDKFFPDLPNASEITIEMLLRHRSGLYNMTSSEDYLKWNTKAKSRSEMLSLFNSLGTVFEPNERLEYSNTNYVLLSYISEILDHQDYDKIIKKRIADPLQLQNTYMGERINTKRNEAQSYTWENDWKLSTETDMSIPMGAGAIVSTASDLNLFYDALFNGKLVSEASLLLMKKTDNRTGLGLFTLPFYNKTSYGHSGGINGFQSMAGYFPEENTIVTYLSNGVLLPTNDIMIGVLSIYFGKKYSLPSFYQVSDEVLNQYPGTYSSVAFPLKLTITRENNALFCQATGQSRFPLQAYEENKFRFDASDIKILFQPEEKILILNQMGGKYEFKMETQ